MLIVRIGGISIVYLRCNQLALMMGAMRPRPYVSGPPRRVPEILERSWAMDGYNYVAPANGKIADANHIWRSLGVTSPESLQPVIQTPTRRVSSCARPDKARRTVMANRKLPNAGSLDLTDCEVLQMVLQSTVQRGTAIRISQALLDKFRTFGGVVNAPANERMAVAEVDEAGAFPPAKSVQARPTSYPPISGAARCSIGATQIPCIGRFSTDCYGTSIT